MIDHPVITHDIPKEAVKLRNEDPSKFLGSPIIKIKSFKNEKDRIREAMKDHEYISNESVTVPFEFRKRDTSKDIQPEMHFTNKNLLDKLAHLNSILGSSNMKALSKSLEFESNEKPHIQINKYIAKNVLPELHVKTHFKAASSLYLDLEDSLVDHSSVGRKSQTTKNLAERGKFANVNAPFFKDDNSVNDLAMPYSQIASKQSIILPPLKPQRMNTHTDIEDHEDNTSKILPVASNYQVENVNPAEVSKSVLIKCNIVRPKNTAIPPLKKGSGHLMICTELPIKDEYEKVYKKRITAT